MQTAALTAPRIPVFGWKSWKLSELSFEQLNELRERIVNDPANANPAHAQGRSVELYTAEARRKLSALAYAVTFKLRERSAKEA